MRWVEDKDDFRKVFLEARTCVYIDSGREPTTLQRLTFDDAEICTIKLAAFLQKLIEWSCDITAYYVVLNPDPVQYFHRHFHKYPALEIALGDSAETYLSFLNQDPGGSPPDAVGTNWWECVILPLSRKWFIHALRSDRSDAGHLWIPPEWRDRVYEAYLRAPKAK